MTGFRNGDGPTDSSRAVAPAVGKALEASIVVLFIAATTAAMYGSVVPDARNAAGDEVGERALQHAAPTVEAAVPAAADSATVERRVALPGAIRNHGYHIVANDGSLVLEHDHPSVGGETPLVLPDAVREVRGEWTGDDCVVRVKPHPDGGLVVVLAEGPA